MYPGLHYLGGKEGLGVVESPGFVRAPYTGGGHQGEGQGGQKMLLHRRAWGGGDRAKDAETRNSKSKRKIIIVANKL